MFKKFQLGHQHSRDADTSLRTSLKGAGPQATSLHLEPDHPWHSTARASHPSLPNIALNRASFLDTIPRITFENEYPFTKTDRPVSMSGRQEHQESEGHLQLTPKPVATPHTLRSSRSSITADRSRLSAAPKHLRYSHSATTLRHQTDGPFTVEGLVQQGIKFHEAGQLERGTEQFRQAAALESPIAMFLYGVSLRHGWGCKKSEHLAFSYLQKAAEHAVLDLNSLSSTVNTSASKGELIVAIYEMGVSFRHGWGCKKNKETAAHFFKIAADLGDPDAQNDLANCYYHGHGAKKDLHLAAKYYRMADQQGHGIMGNSWIWKNKYDKPKK